MPTTAVATSISGLQGKVSNTTWPQLASAIAAGPFSVEGLAPTASGSQRQVTLAAGAATGRGVRGVWGAAVVMDLPTPASGGQWYLIAVRRKPADGLVQIEQVAGATGTDAAQVFPPTAMPAGFLSNQGVEEHQGLLWVYTRVGSSTVQVWDLRLLRTGAANAAAVTLWGLAFSFWSGQMLDGTIMSVLRHKTANGGIHIASRWHRDGTSLLPIGIIDTDSTGAVGRSVRDDVTDVCGTPPLGTMCLERIDSTQFKWARPPADDPTAAVPQWRAWDSEWRPANDFGYQGPSQAPYERKGRYRFHGGRVQYEGQMTLSGGNLSGQLVIGVPIGIDLSRTGGDMALIAHIRLLNASDNYTGYVGAAAVRDSGSININSSGTPETAANPGIQRPIGASGWQTTPFNEQWAQSDQVRFSIEYDPALNY